MRALADVLSAPDIGGFDEVMPLIDGLKTGNTDRDEDGVITVDELYDYVYEQVLNRTPKQTPGKWAFRQQGDIVIAQNRAATHTWLPAELREAIASALPSIRLQGLAELEKLLKNRHLGRVESAVAR